MKKNESKIKCKTCRQYLSSNKMFLHEGFCQKNNIFCEHCEQVFLRKEYDKHIIEISKNLSNKNKQSVIKRLSTDFQGFKSNASSDNIKVIPVKKNSMKLPVIEEYTIRNPIFIGPYSNIISEYNNGFHLTMNDIDLIRRSIYKSKKYNLMTNNVYNYGVTKNILKYNKINYYNKIRMKKINQSNILCNNNIFNENNSILISDKKAEKKNNLKISITDNNFVKNQIDSITLGNDFSVLDTKNKDRDRGKSNDVYLNNNEYKNNHMTNNISTNNKNSIIINNHIITYNSNNNINKINNIFNEVENNKNKTICIDEKKEDNIIVKKYNTKTNVILKKRHIRNDKFNLIEGNSKKEPLDNLSKKIYLTNTYNNKEKKPENRIKKNKYTQRNTEQKIYSLNLQKAKNHINTNKLNLFGNQKQKREEPRNRKVPLNSKKKKQNKNKNINHIKIELNNKKEDIDTSSPDEKNIITIRNIKLTSRNNYKEKLPLKNAIFQRGKSEDNILRSKFKKKVVIFNNKIHCSKKDISDFPEDSKKNLKAIPQPKNSNKIKNIIKI